ncbi:MAG: membrane protein insertion efficiency factor YidD, partial [Spirochaetia bacterium]
STDLRSGNSGPRRLAHAGAAVAHVLIRIPRYLMLVPVYAYRWLISPMLPDTCIYHPSCSHYTVEAILKHGALKGFALGSARVVRCTGGFFDGGHDPVPERFSFAEIAAGYRRHRRRRQGRPDAGSESAAGSGEATDSSEGADPGEGAGR